jgi:cadherin EGF LAG seven-pass G-type receptor 1
MVTCADGINEVRSTCRLYVRLVTRAMLDDSVTVRLGGVEGGGFLSPLYTLFTSAVAAVLRTTPDSVYVIDVSDDSGRRTLNISFSVRAPAATAIGGGQQQGHEMGRQGAGDSRDVFYSASYVRERIYLQHGLLSRLSTLQVSGLDLDHTAYSYVMHH